jgi:hypothetical protein
MSVVVYCVCIYYVIFIYFLLWPSPFLQVCFVPVDGLVFLLQPKSPKLLLKKSYLMTFAFLHFPPIPSGGGNREVYYSVAWGYVLF